METTLAPVVEPASAGLQPPPSEFANARTLVADLFVARAPIYWTDLLLSAATGWLAFVAALSSEAGSALHLIAFVVAVLALFRVACFTHELVHLRRQAVPGLHLAWRILSGIPLLIPHFLYRGVHISHHARREYGTERDGEYFPFALQPRMQIVLHLAWNLIVPALSLLRFALIAPVSLLSAGIRGEIMRKASAMTLRMTFTRELPAASEDLRAWRIEETACSVVAILAVTLVAAGGMDVSVLIHWYVLMAAIALINAYRAIGGTHRYASNGEISSADRQVSDSVNVESRSVLDLLLCPVGLRFHALHHLFPTMPYHNLAIAHHRLREGLPPESSYHACSISSVAGGMRTLWRHCADADLSARSPLKT